MTAELYLGHEVNSVFLSGLGQPWSWAGKQGRSQLERGVGTRQLLSGARGMEQRWLQGVRTKVLMHGELRYTCRGSQHILRDPSASRAKEHQGLNTRSF